MRYGMFFFAVCLLCLGCGTPAAPAQKPAATAPATAAPKLAIPPEYQGAYAIRPGMPKAVVLALLRNSGIAPEEAALQVSTPHEWPLTGFTANGEYFVLSFAVADKDSKQALISIDWLRTIDKTVPERKLSRQWVRMEEFMLPGRN